MLLKLKTTTTEEREVKLPLFFSDGARHYAFIENSTIYFFTLADHITISHRPIDQNDLTRCIDEMPEISEEQFTAGYEKAIKVLILAPKILSND